jgi:glycosyltransferase involved in cell wall biosynthesis
MPRVSVIIPVFNAARTVEQAIASVRAQTFTDFEIVAVDDGSTDGSIETLRRYGPAIKILQQSNRGPSAARNLGIANSTGEYFAFLDADDWWKPEFLARLIAALERDPRCVMSYCDLQLVDSLGTPFQTSLMAVRENRPPTVRDMLESLWPIMPSGTIVRRGALQAVGGFPEPLRAFEDVYLWLLLREEGPFACVPEKLAVWRFAHFPAPLKPSGGQEAAGRIFRQMVKARYGVDPAGHVRSRERAPRSILGYIGLDALARGDRTTARRAFARAIRLDPYRLRNYLRLVRTILPAGMARALSGKSGRVA